ncbi:hypothetical protein C8Q78DRAFT_991374 [Trametes maxima]|nr:hypothetical protein C8Q78DRAFT_991374 [Trametes maxima]
MSIAVEVPKPSEAEKDQRSKVLAEAFHYHKLPTLEEHYLADNSTHHRKGVGAALTQYGEAKFSKPWLTNVEIYKTLGYQLAGSGPIKLPSSGATLDLHGFIQHT